MNREPVYDVAKGILLFFIVYCHSVGGPFAQPHSPWGKQIFENAMNGATMALFFAMSGYFARRTFERADMAKIMARTLTFLWPVLSVSILYGFVAWALGDISLREITGCPYKMFVRLWFFRTIAVVYLLSAVIWKLFRDERLRLAALGVAYLAMLFNPSHYRLFFLSDAMHMFPYFVFGLYLLNPTLWRRLSVFLPCGAFFLAVSFLEGNCWTNGMSFYTITRWQDMFLSAHGWLCFFARPVLGLAGTIFVLGLLDRLLRIVPSLSRVAVFGTTTLGIYAFHVWPLARYTEHPPFQLPNCWALPGALVIFLAFHFVVLAVRANRVSSFLFFGDEKLSARAFGWFFKRLGFLNWTSTD